MTDRIRALDGLRGVAILLVVISHFNDTWLVNGGTVGVTLFFVLSGFLITGILIRGFRFAEFYKRRARRLLPALVVALAASVFLFRDPAWWSYTWPALTYTSNLALVANGENVLNYLLHTWTLSVEEHFYLVWPIVVALVPARLRVRTVGGLLVAALLWRGYLWMTEPYWRVYFGSDGNAAALLAGCFLAVKPLPAPNRTLARWAVVALLVISAMQGVGQQAASFFVIGLAAVAVHSARAWPVLEVRWLVWFGTVSYGLYLWHPMLMSKDASSWLMAPVAVGVAWASWRFVEQPMLRKRLTVDAPTEAGASDPIPNQGGRLLSRDNGSTYSILLRVSSHQGRSVGGALPSRALLAHPLD